MQDYGFYIKRKKETDIPGTHPSDLPSPRHRPGEPIMYDPPRTVSQTMIDPPAEQSYQQDAPFSSLPEAPERPIQIHPVNQPQLPKAE